MAWWLDLGVIETDVNVVNNTSVVTVSLWIGWDYGSWAADNPAYSITIDGTTYSGTANFNTGQASSGSQQVASHSKTITHNSDGSKYCAYSGGYDGSGSGWQSLARGVSLYTIPRNSDITVQNASVNAGGSQKITVTKKSSSYTTVSRVYIPNTNYTMNVVSGVSFTVPLNWLNAIPSATSVSCVAEAKTYSGSTLIGTSTATFNMTCPSYQPTASYSSISPNSTPSVFGSNYVQLLSKIRAVISSSGYYGSTISSIVTTIEGLTYTGSTITSEFIKGSGTVAISSVITDSRGKSRTITSSVNAIAYHYPRMTVKSNALASSSKNVVTITSSISPVSNLNAKILKYVTWTCSDGTSGTLSGQETLGSYEATVTKEHTNIDPTLTYTYSVRIQDSIGNNTQSGVTGIPAISRRAGGKGVTFGGEASGDGLRCLWDATFDGNIKGKLKALGVLDLIPKNSDLNSYLTAGTFGIKSNAIAATIANRPSSYGGTLTVKHANGDYVNGDYAYIIQEYQAYNQTFSYWRYVKKEGAGASWTFSDWKISISTENIYSYASQIKLIWTNSSPSSAFSSKTITTNPSIVDYKAFLVLFKNMNNRNVQNLILIQDKDVDVEVEAIRFVGDGYACEVDGRRIKFSSTENKVTLSGGYYKATTESGYDHSSNSVQIPYKIFGIKGI